MKRNKCIVYIGDFDLRNENVQAHLVRNNGKILTSLGYIVAYIGVNRKKTSFQEIAELSKLHLNDDEMYFELPNTLNLKGLTKYRRLCKSITRFLDGFSNNYCVKYVVSYQSPTYAVAIKKIAKWSHKNGAKYIVNSADLPIFELQSPIKGFVMKHNWDYLHKVTNKYADGVIAVSKYIDSFYKKKGRPSIIVPPLFDTKPIEFEAQPNPVPTFVYAGLPFIITGHEALTSGMKDRLDLIVDLFTELSKSGVPYIFQIIGISKEDYLDSVPRHRDALSSESRISFWGRLNHKETLSFIKQADFSINYREENLMTKAGFSTKIVESISVGTPVIINSISDIFVYLQNGKDAFMLSDSFNDNVNVLKLLCGCFPEQRLAFKRNLFEKRIFDVENYVDSINSFFESVDKTKGT